MFAAKESIVENVDDEVEELEEAEQFDLVVGKDLGLGFSKMRDSQEVEKLMQKVLDDASLRACRKLADDNIVDPAGKIGC